MSDDGPVGSPDIGLFEAMYTCRAMRRLRPDPVDEALLLRLIDAAQQAASGRNLQRGRWIVVRDPAQKQRLADLNRRASEDTVRARLLHDESVPHHDAAARRRMWEAVLWQTEHLHEVPALLVACALLDEPGQDPDRFASSIWPGVQNLLLAARALGLGAVATTWVLRFREEVEEVLGLPADVAAQAVIPVGWPAGRFGPVSRLPAEEVTRFDRWD